MIFSVSFKFGLKHIDTKISKTSIYLFYLLLFQTVLNYKCEQNNLDYKISFIDLKQSILTYFDCFQQADNEFL